MFNSTEIKIMRYLNSNDGSSGGQISRDLHMSKQTVSNNLGKLKGKKAITRKSNGIGMNTENYVNEDVSRELEAGKTSF